MLRHGRQVAANLFSIVKVERRQWKTYSIEWWRICRSRWVYTVFELYPIHPLMNDSWNSVNGGRRQIMWYKWFFSYTPFDYHTLKLIQWRFHWHLYSIRSMKNGMATARRSALHHSSGIWTFFFYRNERYPSIQGDVVRCGRPLDAWGNRKHSENPIQVLSHWTTYQFPIQRQSGERTTERRLDKKVKY